MGILLAATDPDNAARLERSQEKDGETGIGMIGEARGRDMIKYISGEDLDQHLLLPPLNTDTIAGSLFRPRVGYMSRPHELAYEFLQRAEENGVTVESNVKITDITTKSDRVTGVIADDERNIEADEVICAAGPWNIDIAESVGIDIPVEHTLAPIVNLQPETPLEYDLPAINHFESSYAFHRRSRDEILIGYNPGYEDGARYEPGVVSEQVPTEIRDKGLDLLVKLLPKWQDAEIVDEWVGVRSITPDGNPVVGWTGLEGFNIAAFHTSGIQLAPAVGRIVAQQLISNEPTNYYDALSISRFDGYEDWRP